jgi:hypothetical protein
MGLLSILGGICVAQGDPTSLGDLARTLRRNKVASGSGAQDPVIDNDNFDKILAEAESHKPTRGLLFSLEGVGKKFQVSSPDVTCSLAFNAEATALLSNPYAPQQLPEEELAKIDGPATIQGDSMELSVHNGSAWNLREITVGLTLVRSAEPIVPYEAVKLIPASSVDTTILAKQPDLTVLYHLWGSAPSMSTTAFRETINNPPAPDQEWHWAIIEAKGIPPDSNPDPAPTSP